MSEPTTSTVRWLTRGVLVAIVLVAVAFAAGPRVADSSTAVDGVTYELDCARTGPPPADGSLGAVTCTLKVTGLPSPLEHEVAVSVFTLGSEAEELGEDVTHDTVSASAEPGLAPPDPQFIIRHAPHSVPPPLALEPQVPEQPPKAA